MKRIVAGLIAFALMYLVVVAISIIDYTKTNNNNLIYIAVLGSIAFLRTIVSDIQNIQQKIADREASRREILPFIRINNIEASIVSTNILSIRLYYENASSREIHNTIIVLHYSGNIVHESRIGSLSGNERRADCTLQWRMENIPTIDGSIPNIEVMKLQIIAYALTGNSDGMKTTLDLQLTYTAGQLDIFRKNGFARALEIRQGRPVKIDCQINQRPPEYIKRIS